MLLEHYEMDFSQTELMEKFNLAFYEGQQSRLNKLAHEQELIDYLINNDEPSPLLTPTSDAYFDFSDFEKTFQNLPEPSLCDITETCTIFSDDELSQFLGSPRELDDLIDLEFDDSDCSLDNLTDLQDLDQPADIRPINDYLNEDFVLINQQEDDQQQHVDEPGYYFQEERNLEMHEERNVLPPFTSITQNFENKELFVVDETSQPDFDDVISEDLLLSSSSMVYPRRTRQFSESSESSESMVSDDCEISSSSLELVVYQCQWDQCYQIYDSQTNLVKHIEKFHVEVKRGDEFTCFWANCPRQVKPFNARYKLLIHMRVHSGEKPNKCPFQGCNKAFSRLENLKIHQRSHTGERPYLCQFPTCTKSFSNSSDRAKHQRTHFDTKPYACQVAGCTKKYTDPSSLRKHVKNHTDEEQMLIKKKSGEDQCSFNANYVKKFLDPSKQKAQKPKFYSQHQRHNFEAEHNYSNAVLDDKTYSPSHHIKQDLKNKISEKHKLRKLFQQ